MKVLKTYQMIFITFFSMLLFGGPAFAEPPAFTTLTAAVDFSTVISSLLTIMAALAGVFIVMRGGSLILSKIRR
jgi:hypothetical protein